MQSLRREFIKKEEIDELLSICCRNYQICEANKKYSNTLIEAGLKKLFRISKGSSIIKYPLGQGNVLKFLAHLLETSGFFANKKSIKMTPLGKIILDQPNTKINNMTMWNQKDFLLAHLHFLIHCYAQYEKNTQKHSLKISIEVLKKILVREIFICANSFLFISTYPDLCSKKEDKEIKEYIKELLIFVEKSANNGLKQFSFPCGTSSHAIYLTFYVPEVTIESSMNVFIRIDNLGMGSDDEHKATAEENGPKQCFPRFIACEKISELSANEALLDYLVAICQTYVEKHDAKSLMPYKIIYNKDKQFAINHIDRNETYDHNAYDIQTIDNCVTRNYLLGVYYRLNGICFTGGCYYDLLLNEEIEFSVTEHATIDNAHSFNTEGWLLASATQTPSQEIKLPDIIDHPKLVAGKNEKSPQLMSINHLSKGFKNVLSITDAEDKEDRTLSVGNENFEAVIANHVFVDKSMFIKEIIDDGAYIKVILRPRRSGKTLESSMLRSYFDIQKEDGGINFFQGLKIWSQGDKYKKHYHQYPVFFITFKDIKGETYEEVEVKVKRMISKIYLSYKDLVFKNVLNTDDSRYEKELYEKIIERKADWVDVYDALEKMTEYLHKIYKAECMVIIDEYDAPILTGVGKYYEKINALLGNILGPLLKGSPHVRTGILFGIAKLAKTGWYSELNNMVEFNVLSPQFSGCFGFTEAEVLGLLEKLSRLPTSPIASIPELAKRYGGYKIGNNSQLLFNPWSIVRSISAGTPEGLGTNNYWAAGTENKLILDALNKRAESSPGEIAQLSEDFSILYKDGYVEKAINESITFSEIENDLTQLWSCLLFAGWLTLASNMTSSSVAGVIYQLKFPNQETKNELCKQFGKILKIKDFSQAIVSPKNVLKSLSIGHSAEPKTAVSGFFHKLPDSTASARQNNETFNERIWEQAHVC